VYYNCVKFHKNSISSLVEVSFTRYMPPLFRESIRWIISPFKFWTATIFLHVRLQVVYYNCVKFHKNPISRLGGVALTRYIPPFRESISWIISPFKFWTATIFLHAHLQVVYYKCAKFDKNPISRLRGVALTRYMDGRTDGQNESYIPPNFACGGYNKQLFHPENQGAYLQNG
jgi:hypothetical protein